MLATNYQRMCYHMSTVLVKVKLKVIGAKVKLGKQRGDFYPSPDELGVRGVVDSARHDLSTVQSGVPARVYSMRRLRRGTGA